VKIDLHGYQIHDAWKEFNNAINEAYHAGRRSVVVVTGQGMMMREFPTWALRHVRVREVKQHNHNPGSFSVKLKKVPKKG
jgi:DNA-nicking Smr family endonuclease